MSGTVDLTLLTQRVKELLNDIRAVRREMLMLRAQQNELPTSAQFSPRLAALDERVTKLHQETNAVIRELTDLRAIHGETSAGLGLVSPAAGTPPSISARRIVAKIAAVQAQLDQIKADLAEMRCP